PSANVTLKLLVGGTNPGSNPVRFAARMNKKKVAYTCTNCRPLCPRMPSMKPTNHSTKISKVLRAVSVPSGTTGSRAACRWRRATNANVSSAAMTSVAVAVCAGNKLSPGMTDTHVNECSTSTDPSRCEQSAPRRFVHAGHQQQRHPEREAHAFDG